MVNTNGSKPLNPEAAAFRPRFEFYRESYPDPSLHGDDKFVAALPAQDKIPTAPHSATQLQPAWHTDAAKVGVLYSGHSVFVKHRKHGCISLIYEQALRNRGTHGYSFTIIDGYISASDGVGFVFGDRVPCSKNVKRLWSVFANRAGHVVQRMGPTLIRSDNPSLPPLAVGQTVSMVLDLNQFRATFQTSTTADVTQVLGRCHVDLSPIASRVDCSRGYLCAAVTRTGMVVHIDSAPAALLDKPAVLPVKQQYSQSHSYRHPPLPHQQSPQQQRPLPPPQFPLSSMLLPGPPHSRAAHIQAQALARNPQHDLLLQSELLRSDSGWEPPVTSDQIEQAMRLLQQQQQQLEPVRDLWRAETVPAGLPSDQIFDNLISGASGSVDTACLARTREEERLWIDMLLRNNQQDNPPTENCDEFCLLT